MGDTAVTFSGVQIDQLKSSNYQTWYHQVKCVLMQKGYEKLIEEESNSNKEEGYGMSVILATLNQDDKIMVLGCSTTKQMIELLAKRYHRGIDEYTITDELIELQWTRSTTAEQYINALNVIRRKFKLLDGKIADKRFILKMIKDMPSCLSSLKVHYDYLLRVKKEKVDYDELCDAVIHAYEQYMNSVKVREQRQERNNNRTFNQDVSLIARQQGCYICGSLDHRCATCPKNRFRVNQSRYDQVQQAFQNNRRGNNDLNNGQERYQNNGQGNNQYNQQDYNNGYQNNQSGHNYQGSYNYNSNNHNSQGNVNGANNQQFNSYQNRSQQSNNQSTDNRRSRQTGSMNASSQNNRNDTEDASLCAVISVDSTDCEYFRLDDASTIHITNQISDFATYQEYKEPSVISGVENGFALGEGVVYVTSVIGDRVFNLKLSGVRYMPNVKYKILSELVCENKGCLFEYNYTNRMNFKFGIIKGVKMIEAKRPRGSQLLYRTNIKPKNRETCCLTDEEWHGIFCHRNYTQLDRTSHCVEGMKIQKTDDREQSCVSCIQAKPKRRHFDHSLLKETRIGHTLHTDINNLPSPSLKGKKYAIHLSDEASKFKRVYFLKHVNATEIKDAIDRCVKAQIDEIGITPARIHSDRGLGYMSDEVKKYLWTEYKIEFTHSTAYNHEQNGFSEKVIQDTTAATRAMLISKDIPQRMWAEAYNTAIYVSNRTYNRSIEMTPFERYYGYRPSVGHMKEFGSDVYQYIPAQSRNKLDPRAKLMKFIGYTNSTVNYRIADPTYRTVVEDTNVYFVNKQEKENKVTINLEETVEQQSDQSETDEEDEANDQNETTIQDENREKVNDETKSDERKIKDQIFEYLIHSDDVKIPTSINEVEENEFSELFKEAMDREVMQWFALNAIKLVERKPEMKILRAHWLWSVKTNEHGFVDKFKARYVVDGSNLNEGRYAPTLNSNSLRVLLASGTSNRCHMHVIDIKTAYLNTDIDKPRYIYQIKGYEDTNRMNYVAELLKSSYGLPDSAYLWYKKIRGDLIDFGLHQSRVDQCVFHNQTKKLILALHTDDIKILCSDIEPIEQVKAYFGSKYEIVDNGEIRMYLGLEVRYLREKGVMYIHQNKKIKELYQQVKEICPNETQLPIPSNTNVYKESELYKDIFLYQSVIGALNYLAHISRPDVMIYVTRLSKFLKSPTEHHMQLALRLVAYLQSTNNLTIKYQSDGKSNLKHLTCYTDAGSNDAINERGKCTSGVVLMVDNNLIMWSSRKQTAVTDEICCAELYAINYGLKASLQIRNLMLELGLLKPEESAIELLCDNKSALDISEDGFKKNSRHYDVSLLFVKDFIQRNVVKLSKVHTTQNLADMFTKFPDYNIFDTFRAQTNQKFLIKKSDI